MAFDIKKRKRELIKKNIKSVPLVAGGEKITRVLVIIMLLLRAALLLFEIIYSSVTGTETSIWSHLLFIPFVIVVFMMYDGNKAFVYIPMISAPIRLVYHFSAVLPVILPEGGISAVTIFSLIVLASQFFFSIVLSASTKCDVYFSTMQKINLKLRSEMINGGKK